MVNIFKSSEKQEYVDHQTLPLFTKKYSHQRNFLFLDLNHCHMYHPYYAQELYKAVNLQKI